MPTPVTDLQAHCGRDQLADNHLQVTITLQSTPYRLQTPSVLLPGNGAKRTPLNVVAVSEIPRLALTDLACSMVPISGTATFCPSLAVWGRRRGEVIATARISSGAEQWLGDWRAAQPYG